MRQKPLRFLNNHKELVWVDRLAQRYGVLPTVIVRLSLDDYGLLSAIAAAGYKQDKKDADQMRREQKKAARNQPRRRR